MTDVEAVARAIEELLLEIGSEGDRTLPDKLAKAAVAAYAQVKWRPISDAPRDIKILCYSPGNKKAWNENAREAYCKVDKLTAKWEKFQYQYPEAPYAFFQLIQPPEKKYVPK